ncbi:MAG TPA: hypothetical protein PKE42_02925 [Arachnia sp.]|jgi:energy-coupling factor transport system substrate-specific component|nr:hypothetical protein [Arachnia sp.]
MDPITSSPECDHDAETGPLDAPETLDVEIASLDRPETLDDIAAELRRLRLAAGDVSFGEIAIRVARRRVDDGKSPAAARIARSSVHSMFADGRSRMNADLVAELVLALGGDPAQAQELRRRCLLARPRRAPSAGPPTPDRSAAPERSEVPDQSAPERSEVPETSDVPKPSPSSSPPRPGAMTPGRAPTQAPLVRTLLLAACVGLNHFGGNLQSTLQLPLFLDMIGTAVAAIVLGPWHGAAVGLATNLIGTAASTPDHIAFALVNVAGALVWGYGVRAWRMRAPWWRFLALNLIVALACTLIAVPINVLVFDGFAAGHVASHSLAVLVDRGMGIWQAAFVLNLLVSVADKVLSGYVAVGLAKALERGSLSRSPSTASTRPAQQA